ncbi:MAG TPA: signal peptide peptidase SppA [bacterium]|nr:signal peptide peptidase SppA [bacterium]
MKTPKIFTFLIFLVIISILLIIINLFSSKNITTSSKSPSKAKIDFSILSKKKVLADKSIKVINIYGPIYFTDEQNFFGEKSGADNIVEELNATIEEENIVGLLLRINSPGGTVAASQEIYNGLLKFREKTKKPVVVSVADLAASGAYYISAAADTIFVNQSSIVGNIGVIMTGVNIKKLLDKVGVEPNVYVSDKHKDMGSPYREATAEEKKIFQDAINALYKQFVEAVKTGRSGKIKAEDKILFDGRMFTGADAVQNGLADFTGGYIMKHWIIYGKLPEIPAHLRFMKRSHQIFGIDYLDIRLYLIQ